MTRLLKNMTNKECKLCGTRKKDISAKLGVCKECIQTDFQAAMTIASKARTATRKQYNLPLSPPKTKEGLLCGDCVNNCVLGEGETGYCNLVKNVDNNLLRIAGDDASGGLFSFYYDALPTNCVAEPFCPGCTGAGYPQYSYAKGPEIGRHNLAVFYQACTYDCLFCQNYQYRKGVHLSQPISSEVLIDAIRKNTSCLCFFGGDPAAQIKHSNAVGKKALAKAQKEKRIFRVCWETNGSAKPSLMEETTAIALASGGTIKIDLKAFDDRLIKALCGSSNRYSIQNIKNIGRKHQERPEVPLLVVSTLLIPGYVDYKEVGKIAELIAQVDPTIPYSLLAFYPTFVMDDLPTTSKKQAERCYQAAKEQGIERVSIGNKHLLR
jgi:pyruvate formate lyase activating enzyme